MTHTNDDDRGPVFDDKAKITDFERATALLDPSWLDNAACQDKDIDDFFIPEGKAQVPSIDVAMTCRSCPVRKECLLTIAEFEGESHPSHTKGIFAGMSPQSRQRIYKLPLDQWQTVSQEMLTDYLEMKIRAQRDVPIKTRRAQLKEIGRA